ncbi:MAG: hypothetical protein D6696_17400 [Acidobacteria bacterium]|nr:MAG: hypothetical protein D6696_17400 [Acidobacteriota bacterium]
MTGKHKSKEIQAAIAYALDRGWRLERARGRGHAWGTLYCPLTDRGGCRFTVWGTPAIPEAHARDLRRTVDRCEHG